MNEPASSPVVTLFWDFFGARAEGTARHFEIHLGEFLEKESIEGCRIGVESTQAHHWAAWCEAPARLEESLTAALRPRRRRVGSQPTVDG